MNSKLVTRLSPEILIVLSFIATIAIGTILLALPVARTVPVSFLDLLFDTTSITCVTGLSTIPLETFTPFGQTIVMILTQIGGLGIITLTIFLMSFFTNFGFATQLMAGKVLELESQYNVKRLIIFIILLTVICEIAGTLFIYGRITGYQEIQNPFFTALFHSISSFCSAGISLIPASIYSTDYGIMLPTTILMLAGGLGFITWMELLHYLRSRNLRKKYKLSLHSKIILYTSVILITLATTTILVVEYSHAFFHLNIFESIVHSFFHAINFRGCGFETITTYTFTNATLFLAFFTALIGASPGSTSSGIKLTSIALFFVAIKAALSHRPSVEIKGRTIAPDQINKAIAIIAINILCIITATFLLLTIDRHIPFSALFFEAMSAISNFGLSIGATSALSAGGKIIIICLMIIGRIGAFTFLLALRSLRKKQTSELVEFSYPTERVILS